jgi:outer membrane protein assembly factor BamB
VDGLVDAQPLYASAVSMPDGLAHNLLLAATEHASVYAFDAETGATLWKTSLLGVGEAPSDDRGCGQVSPEIGVTSSPVIDRTRGIGGVIYAVAMSKSGSQYYQRLHTLDLTTGHERPGSPVTVQATYPGTGDNSVSGQVVFDAKQYKERAALLMVNGAVITT